MADKDINLDISKKENKVMKLIDKLALNGKLSKDEYITVLKNYTEKERLYAKKIANDITEKHFQKKIFLRGLIEFSNYCKNDCYYCGLRKSNLHNSRYRLNKEDIIECCEYGYKLGLRTFVLQSGEDLHYTEECMIDIVSTLRKRYPDCAITLSIGEKSKDEYQKYFLAGADRFLLRHETATKGHYTSLHPNEMSFTNRIDCLKNLKEIGYQTGCGFMVGSPYQTLENLAQDLCFIQEFKPHMVGIGPFIPHKDTPFKEKQHGDIFLTIMLVSLVRIMLKNVLLPATTALGSVDGDNRKLAILSGANVIMPNISPLKERKKYMLYDNKICANEDTEIYIENLKISMKKLGYEVVVDRGDYKI